MDLIDALLLDPYFPLDYYISARADNVGGTGTINDPLNGSTPEAFDKLMRDVVPANARIHIGPGTFKTYGYYDGASGGYGWQMKPGWKISGSGMDVTKLQIVNATANDVLFLAIAHALSSGGAPNPMDFCEISDLTVDCALSDASNTGASAFGAIRLMGNHVRVARVKAIRWGKKTSAKPCFVISVITADRSAGLVQFIDAGIEGCIAVEPDTSGSNAGPATAIHAGGKEEAASSDEAFGTGPFIRNCFVDCASPTATPEYRGLSMSWCKAGIIEGNQVHNTKFGGPYQDKASAHEVIVRENTFKNCFKGPFWNLGSIGPNVITSGSGSLAVSGSVATLTLPAAHNFLVGDRVQIAASVTAFNGIHEITGVTSTTFTFSTSVTTTPATVTSVAKVFGVDKLLIEGNIVEMAQQTSGEVIAIHPHDSALGGQDPVYPAFVHGEVVIRDNKIRYLDSAFQTSPAYIGYGVQVNGAKKVIVHGNLVEAVPANPIQNLRCGAVTYFHNDTPAGALIQGYNGGNQTKYSELETEADDALLLTLI